MCLTMVEAPIPAFGERAMPAAMPVEVTVMIGR